MRNYILKQTKRCAYPTRREDVKFTSNSQDGRTTGETNAEDFNRRICQDKINGTFHT